MLKDKKKIINIKVEGIDMKDSPNFCDSFISRASYINSKGKVRKLTDRELEELNNDSSFVYNAVINNLM